MDEAVANIWYVTRKYPPSVGGMQRLAHQIVTALRAEHSPVVIAWSRSQLGLPLFVAYAAVRILVGHCAVEFRSSTSAIRCSQCWAQSCVAQEFLF
jgi:hypothetical protein